MKKAISFILFLISSPFLYGQLPILAFEKSHGKQTATYLEAIDFYKKLDKTYPTISIKTFGETDAGYPLHLVLFSNDRQFSPLKWKAQNKVIVLINNGIHPGEPDGIDASMMLLRDIAAGKIKVSENVVVAVIPIYNIGGALNRNSFSRVNQDGPESYGFRGNAQNLDLNRDFTKMDSRNAQAFATIFHYLQPHVLIDNHVSDGADYQHTMTLLSTQHNKLGSALGMLMHDKFDPAIYQKMKEKEWPMVPYVNFEDANPEKGWAAFYDPPRYSSGYASLFQTIAYVPETHMLKPYKQRVQSTYALMQAVVEEAGKQGKEIIRAKQQEVNKMLQQTEFAISWKIDSTKADTINFKGYEAAYKTSEVTGMPRLYYDRNKPFEKNVAFYNYFMPDKVITAPKAYIIPQGWYKIVERLLLNNVIVKRLHTDTSITVETYKITGYKSFPKPYESHHKNYDVTVEKENRSIRFLKGDYIVYTDQPARRFIVEMLEPEGDDSYFAWNFFDAILQQKEGYSDYRWEDVAATYLKEHPELREELEATRKANKTFAESSKAQLYYVYTHSPFYEPAHNRYPVYRLK